MTLALIILLSALVGFVFGILFMLVWAMGERVKEVAKQEREERGG